MNPVIKSSITDIPRNVSFGEKDTFGIEPFENGLTTFIKSTNTPITIALQGEWGSGKTSLMNSLKENLSNGENADFHSVWLNTWEYALMKDANSTLLDILTGLIKETSKISKADETQTKKLVNKLLGVGKTAFKFAAKQAANKVVDGSSEIVDGFFESNGDSTISEVRSELEDMIAHCIEKDNKEGFIFFIDDLDRIDPPVAVQLLELLKNIFTLKNCIFILAIDYDVVIKGLEPKFGKLSEHNEREFRSFFDKIIQVPFSMPVTSYRIDDFLKESLVTTNYLKQEFADNKDFIAKLSEISSLTVGSNPRALKRLLNSLSLIRCINATKNLSEENDNLDSELDLLINFSLVSIQIAYPPVYRLLSIFSGFDKWNENVALQMNLKPLDDVSIQKLSKSEEFDEEWEQVLFRLCENDHYLKRKALNISRLLNSLKEIITEKGEDIEDIIGSVISLSSVTNLEAFDKPMVDYHRGAFLKNMRNKLIPALKTTLPEIADLIQSQGKRVQSNAFIKFTKENWGHWIRLHSYPIDGKVCMNIASDKWIAPIKENDLQTLIKKASFNEQFSALENTWEKITANHPAFKQSSFYQDIVKRDNFFILNLNISLTLPTIDDFYKKENIEATASVTAELYHFLVQLQKTSAALKQVIK